MRVSIVVADNVVVVDKKALASDCSALAAEKISAVQWYGDHGEMEYAGHEKPNEQINDFAPYQTYVDNAKPITVEPSDELKAEADRLNALASEAAMKAFEEQMRNQPLPPPPAKTE